MCIRDRITLTSGTVYYGGLLGFIASVHWYLHRYHLNAPLFWDCLAPALPLFHVFGRIGCFLNGCCYGVESRHFGLAFTCSLSAPNGVPYFPVQLAEAAFEALIFLLVWRFALRTEGHGKALPFYLLLYAPVRFLLEFLRGDAVRGIWFGLSTSQWLSLALFAFCASALCRNRKKRTSKCGGSGAPPSV